VVGEMSRLMDIVIEEKRARMAAAGVGSEGEDILDVLLRMQANSGVDAPLDTPTIRAVIRVRLSPLRQQFSRHSNHAILPCSNCNVSSYAKFQIHIFYSLCFLI
jgi:hypothetical protein